MTAEFNSDFFCDLLKPEPDRHPVSGGYWPSKENWMRQLSILELVL